MKKTCDRRGVECEWRGVCVCVCVCVKKRACLTECAFVYERGGVA